MGGVFDFMPRGGEKHEARVREYLKELELEGYSVVNLIGKSPDGIAVKDGKIFAVEILKKVRQERNNYDPGRHHGRYIHRFQGGWTLKQKRMTYDMFEDVLFAFYS